MKDIIDKIKAELALRADESVMQSGLRFFKEDVKILGVKSAEVKHLAKSFYKEVKSYSKKEIFSLCETLLKSGIIEESFIACHWSYNLKDKYLPDDFEVFQRWVENYVTNWATCDTLCNHTVGDFLIAYPEFVQRLKSWAKSNNRWMRRASCVSLIIPAKNGLFLDDIFEISDLLMQDEEDLVRKGYGWMLKSACEKHEDEVFSYIIKNKSIMPRTALRYAIEKMPLERKKAAMGK
ncbi:MAG TPA: DNA alkylation repair protein [Spirochaetota bacterium]|nr:DNA alkylation repair protein [Spirochaetota bacterium]HOK91685.1 DNA alkylation repair protein [Spirochaetota bacterium]HPD78801.1 DNA alkylation repair protein [Spirochaetota bacterium]HPP94454.1 DNA alkylation repair protein [Spirochaetota bacterium]HRS61918.1 DNA alkylation repair protein [Spirochaetota bacterium]